MLISLTSCGYFCREHRKFDRFTLQHERRQENNSGSSYLGGSSGLLIKFETGHILASLNGPSGKGLYES